MTIGILFLAAVLLGRGCRRAPPPLIIERPVSSTTTSAPNSGAPTSTTPTTQPSPAPADLYTCGARTKKGTPCSRRVHGPVRCWQHKGAPAMLPQEKLRIKE